MSDAPESSSHVYLEVALPLPVRHGFTYKMPAELQGTAKLGARVVVPFGKRSFTGYIIGFPKRLPADGSLSPDQVRAITSLEDEEPLITPEIFELSRWAADHYLASWGEMLKASLPAGINVTVDRSVSITERGRLELRQLKRQGTVKHRLLSLLSESDSVLQSELLKDAGRSAAGVLRELIKAGFAASAETTVEAKVKPKRRKAVRLLSNDAEAEGSLPEQHRKVLSALRENGGEMFFSDLLERSGVSSSPVTTLAKKGSLEIFIGEEIRDPLTGYVEAKPPELTLTPDQSTALNRITAALSGETFKAFLLHGVTGSGKTEVYIRAMRKALDEGLSSLMLVPEIALTPVFSRRLRDAFGDKVAILHSNLSAGERFDEWRRIRSGEARIVIGTRSAVFAPLADPGLIIVDEEHDASYRQNESPFYHGRDVAVMRAHRAGAVVVLGSATPSLESFNNAHIGKYEYLRMPERIGGRPLAEVELIDMREVFKRAGKDVVISPKLAEAIEETHRRGEQTMMLLNRRGFSSFVLCRSCGESLRCKNCDITLTYHKSGSRLVCHYCSYTTDPPSVCPFCESEYLYFIGQGTEQIEELLRKQFPQLRIARVDRDTMKRKGELDRTLLAFDRGELDLLVGTQILAKGHDFHNVTLVGVVSVDNGLGLPDYHAAERTFQLLTQVAGRAGRGSLAGRVLIQTYHPEHYALQRASKQDFDGFFEEEMRYRERLGYPPYCVVASIMAKHRDRPYAMRTAEILRRSLDKANAKKDVRILGPAEASIARIKNEWRIQTILKSPNRKLLRELIDSAMREAEASGSDRRILQVQIDPLDLL